MSSCCSDHQEPEATSNEKDEREPTGMLKKFLWKIGRADAQKKQDNSHERKGCC